MLTFFEYLRNRAYESIVLGANEALEFLEKEKSNPAADGSEMAGLPRKRKSLDFQEPDQQTDNQPQETGMQRGGGGRKLASSSTSWQAAKRRVEPIMTDREKDILRALATDVRTLSDRQIATTWWSDCPTGLHRCRVTLNRLQRMGWVVLGKVLARSVEPGSNPVYCWSPGDASPDFLSYSQILHKRVLQKPKQVTICVATEKTNNLLGVGRRSTVRLTQLTHELQVSEVYLHYRNLGLDNVKWLGEDRLPADWRLAVRPDALLVNSQGNFVRAVEYGGDYLPKRLTELHEALSSILLNYEVW